MFRLSARNTSAAVVGLAALAIPLVAMLPGSAGGWGFIALVAVALGAGAAWVVSEVRAVTRRKELTAFAERIGWTFEERSLVVAEGLRSYPFGTGVDRADIDVLAGVFQDRRCAHFVHSFTERHRSSTGPVDREVSVTREFQITAVELGAAYPTIDILPEDIVAFAAKLVGGMDVDFESAEFNRRWRVTGGEPRYVHDMITPRVMDRLVQDDARGMAIRIEGRNLLTWRAGRSTTEELASTLAVLTSVAKVLPTHVERALREEQAAREANAPGWATTPGALTSGRYTALGQQMWEAEEAERRALAEAAEREALAEEAESRAPASGADDESGLP
jgi:hypothetical protein